jgi:hypothetical protein
MDCGGKWTFTIETLRFKKKPYIQIRIKVMWICNPAKNYMLSEVQKSRSTVPIDAYFILDRTCVNGFQVFSLLSKGDR